MFFVRMIRLIPLVVILLVIALIIYLVAQAKYNPTRAKMIVIRVFIWITSILTGIFLLACLYSLLDKNMAVFELFLSFAAVPAMGLVITLICRTVLLKHYPAFKHKAMKTSHNESFVDFWKKKIRKKATEYFTKKFSK